MEKKFKNVAAIEKWVRAMLVEYLEGRQFLEEWLTESDIEPSNLAKYVVNNYGGDYAQILRISKRILKKKEVANGK